MIAIDPAVTYLEVCCHIVLVVICMQERRQESRIGVVLFS
jgi:hypothetical protein